MTTTTKTTTLGFTALVLTALMGGAAQADHNTALRGLFEHAADLECLAERADRDIRYYFKDAPEAKCLREQFCLIQEKAIDLQKGLSRNVNLHDVEECLEELDDAYLHVQKHMVLLRKWSQSCTPQTVRFGHGSFTICASSGPSELYLRRLCGRVEEMGEVLGCMINEVEVLMDSQGHSHTHGNRLSQPVNPVPQQRVQPVLPPPPSQFSPALGRPVGRGGNAPVLQNEGRSPLHLVLVLESPILNRAIRN